MTIALLQRAAEALENYLFITADVHYGMDVRKWPVLVQDVHRVEPGARAVLAEIRAEIEKFGPPPS